MFRLSPTVELLTCVVEFRAPPPGTMFYSERRAYILAGGETKECVFDRSTTPTRVHDGRLH